MTGWGHIFIHISLLITEGLIYILGGYLEFSLRLNLRLWLSDILSLVDFRVIARISGITWYYGEFRNISFKMLLIQFVRKHLWANQTICHLTDAWLFWRLIWRFSVPTCKGLSAVRVYDRAFEPARALMLIFWYRFILPHSRLFIFKFDAVEGRRTAIQVIFFLRLVHFWIIRGIVLGISRRNIPTSDQICI